MIVPLGSGLFGSGEIKGYWGKRGEEQRERGESLYRSGGGEQIADYMNTRARRAYAYRWAPWQALLDRFARRLPIFRCSDPQE